VQVPKPDVFSISASKTVTLRLPAVKDIPLPSPQLIHNWDLDSKKPKLVPFMVNGIWMRPPEAISTLLAFSAQPVDASLSPAADSRFWSMVGALSLETLAAHKLVPVIVNDGRDYYSRWLPVLDSPKDATRLKQLEDAMPAVCRAALEDVSPKHLLTSFLNTFCDALAREWGKSAAPKFYDDAPAVSWIKALFSDNAIVKLSPAQAQILRQVTKRGCGICTSRAMPRSELRFGWKRPPCNSSPGSCII
jgi:hypothetical protein